MANFFRLAASFILALLLGFTASANAAVPTCADLKATLKIAGEKDVADGERDTTYCLSLGYPASNCAAPGSHNYLIKDRVSNGFTQLALYTSYIGPSYFGSPKYENTTAWETCTGPLTETESAAKQAKTIADSLNLIGAPLCYTGTPALTTCYAGFVIRGSLGGTGGGTGTGTQSCVYGPFTSDGTTCTGTGTGTTTSTPSTCKKGQVPGEVNGVSVCVTAGTTTSTGGGTTTTETTTNPDGTTTTDGTGTKTSTTTCDGATCTTTTTTTTTTGGSGGGGGSAGETTTTTVPQASYCAENPGSAQCKPEVEGTFAGACGSAPACTGDAVQCAQATYVFQAACSLAKPPDSAESAAYAAAVANADGDKTADLPGNSTVNLSPGSFDQSEFLGAGTGMRDVTISVMGSPITLSFAEVNLWLARLGNVLLACTFLLCIRIVTRG